MQFLFNSIENVRAQPHHIRRQVAFTIAGGIAAVIGLFWLIGSLSMGTFALKPSSFADVGGTVETSGFSSDQVAGVAAASRNNDASGSIVVVDAPKPAPTQAEQTVIPF